jgi:hypothetical protein
MGSNNCLKIYQTTNNFELFYQIIQIIQIICYEVNFVYVFSVHCIFSPIEAQRPTKYARYSKTGPILNFDCGESPIDLGYSTLDS